MHNISWRFRPALVQCVACGKRGISDRVIAGFNIESQETIAKLALRVRSKLAIVALQAEPSDFAGGVFLRGHQAFLRPIRYFYSIARARAAEALGFRRTSRTQGRSLT